MCQQLANADIDLPPYDQLMLPNTRFNGYMEAFTASRTSLNNIKRAIQSLDNAAHAIDHQIPLLSGEITRECNVVKNKATEMHNNLTEMLRNNQRDTVDPNEKLSVNVHTLPFAVAVANANNDLHTQIFEPYNAVAITAEQNRVVNGHNARTMERRAEIMENGQEVDEVALENERAIEQGRRTAIAAARAAGLMIVICAMPFCEAKNGIFVTLPCGHVFCQRCGERLADALNILSKYFIVINIIFFQIY